LVRTWASKHGAGTRDHVPPKVLNAQVSKEDRRRRKTTFIGRVVMDKPVVRFALSAAVVVAVTLRLFEFIIPCPFGVARAQEKEAEQKKEEAGLGFTCRQRQTQTQPGLAKPVETTTMIRQSPLRDLRMDTYYQGKLDASTYVNYTEGVTITLFHTRKMYTRRTGPKGPLPVEQTCDPRPRLKKALAGAYKKLGRRTIEGIEAEGIEVPEVQGTLMGNDGVKAKLDSAASQFWSSVETGCPILVEETMVAFNGTIRVKTIRDQFRWNVRFDPNEFKAKIPPDYQPDTRLPGQGGFGGFGRGAMTGPSGRPKPDREARR
jgi:hypothetical protein